MPAKDSQNRRQRHNDFQERFLAHNLTSNDIDHLLAVRQEMTPVPHMYSPKDDGSESHPIQPTRPRSRSIKIKRSLDYRHDDNASAESDRLMYDWATWRMYHRISSFRQARASARAVHPFPTVGPAARLPVVGDMEPTSHTPNTMHHCASAPTERTPLHEGVFVLDI